MAGSQLDEKVLDEIIIQGILVNDSFVEAINSHINKSFALLGFLFSFIAFSFQSKSPESQNFDEWVLIQCFVSLGLIVYLLEIYLGNSTAPSANALASNLDFAKDGIIEIKKQRIYTLNEAIKYNQQKNEKSSDRVINAVIFFLSSLVFGFFFQSILKTRIVDFVLTSSFFEIADPVHNILLSYLAYPSSEFLSLINVLHCLFSLSLSFIVIWIVRSIWKRR